MENEEKHLSFHRKDLRPHVEHRHKTPTYPDKLKQYADNGSFVIRKLDPIHIHNFNTCRDTPEASVEDTAIAIREQFRQLETFGIRIPPTFIIPDKDPEPAIFVVVKNVKGMGEGTYDEEDLAKEYGRTLGKLLDYFETTGRSGAPYLLDIDRRSQYAYGTIEPDQEPHLYLVDADPVVTKDRIEPERITYLKYLIPEHLRRENFGSLMQRIENLRHTK